MRMLKLELEEHKEVAQDNEDNISASLPSSSQNMKLRHNMKY